MRSLDAVAVLTADRPGLAQRCAESYLDGHSHPGALFIMDDSSGGDASTVPDFAAHLSRTYGIPVRYAGRAERRNYVSQLTALGVPPDVAAFTLLGDPCVAFTAGANRNAALLESVGRRFLMADDDTVARTAVPCATTETAAIAGHHDPSDIDFFPLGTASAAAHWSPVDVVTETSRVLGSHCAAPACGCLAGIETTIRMTTCGVVGDSGYFSSSHLLWMSAPPTHEKLRRSEPLLNTAFTSREVIRMVPRPTITHATVCMATTLGLDHTRPLPPFLPVCRNEDGFFGNLMIRAFPAACTAHLPFAVVHDPPVTRAYERLPEQPQTIRLSELLILLMAASPTGSLDALGRFLIEISQVHFESLAREIVRNARRELIRRIEEYWALPCAPATPAWLRQATALKSSIWDLIESPSCCLPSDIPASELRRIVALTGKMLVYWNEITGAAQRLAADGIKITTKRMS